MPLGQLTGSRIRERRVDLGVKQADLAQRAGISPSYLNLIEHNRRRIAGRLLNDIARALDTDPAQLAEGTDLAQIERLRSAAAALGAAQAETARTEEFAGRFPGWSHLVAAQAARIATLESRVQALTDRLVHDPYLASSLHEVLSAATSIRSTASILASDEAIDADWQARFHRNIHADSQRLAESSRRLVAYLDAPQDDGGAGALSPVEEADAWLEARGYHIDAAETGGAVAEILSQAGLKGAVAAILTGHLTRYVADARLLPLGPFAERAAALAYDPAALCRQFGVAPDVVLRRLASLPAEGHPDFGLVISDASGALGIVKPVEGMALPRGGAACPLWPVFTALGQPGRAIRAVVALPSEPARRFLCHAVATDRSGGVGAAPGGDAVMLVRPWTNDAGPAPEPVGIGCRVCPRAGCTARREPSVLTGSDRGAGTF